jgi:hypothetical protein
VLAIDAVADHRGLPLRHAASDNDVGAAPICRGRAKWRVDAFRIFLDIKLPDLTAKQREEVLDILRGI